VIFCDYQRQRTNVELRLRFPAARPATLQVAQPGSPLGLSSPEEIQNAGQYVINQLQNGRPVKTYVYETHRMGASGNQDGSHHVISIVAYGWDNKGFYFRFFDNGTKNQKLGTHADNRLYFEPSTLQFRMEIRLIYYYYEYIATQFRMNK